MDVRAAVAFEAGKPLQVETVQLEGPKAFEVMVEMGLIDGIVTVTEEEIQRCLLRCWLELKLAIDGEFPATLDATKNAYQLVRLGLAETLTRLTSQMKLEPWLAKDVTNLDATTWRVSLRPNARFSSSRSMSGIIRKNLIRKPSRAFIEAFEKL